MTRYIGKRLVAMIPVLFLVSVIVFTLIRLIPGDPAVAMLGEEATPQMITALRAEFGLDQPIPVQYAIWLGRVLRGDLGNSTRARQPVTQAIVERLPATIELTILSLLISLTLAIPIGIISATRRNSKMDLLSTTLALMGVSMPNFFLALLLTFVLSLNLRLLPNIGYVPIMQNLHDNLIDMIMPAITLSAATLAIVARLTRSSLLEVLNLEYIRTARAKGLGERLIIIRHALKNSMIPVVTIVGLQVGALLGGAVITESIFVLPGVGKLAVDAIFSRDFPVIQGVVLFFAVVFLGVNLIVDLLYAFLDPRIHYA